MALNLCRHACAMHAPCRGLLASDRSMWRFAFLAGMAAGALPLTALVGPATFDLFPATYTVRAPPPPPWSIDLHLDPVSPPLPWSTYLSI